MSSGLSKWGNKGKGVVMTSARMGVRGEVGWRNDRTSLNNSGTDHSFLLPPLFLQWAQVQGLKRVEGEADQCLVTNLAASL